MKMIPVTSCANCDKKKKGIINTFCGESDIFKALIIDDHIANNTIHPRCPLDECDTKEVSDE